MATVTIKRATAIARAAMAMQHLPGTEDRRLADACDDAGLQWPPSIAVEPEAMRNLKLLVSAIRLRATDPNPASPGRPALPPGEARTGRLSMRTFPDIEAKAKRVGTEAIEAAIRRIKAPAK